VKVALRKEDDHRLAELMRWAQDGNKAAYESLLKETCLLLRGYIQQRVGHCEAAEDVLQETLISIHQARHTFNHQKAYAPWMFAIARYRIADYWRKQFRLIEQRMSEDFDAPQPEKAPVGSELLERLSRAMDNLPVRQKQAVHLLKIQGLSIRDAAEQLEITESALKVTAHRAYKTLRRRFENENNEYN
jgi:RNA polymerase sigma-70 factor, ECF subfamily